MIEIRSREEAERELGKYGVRLWGEKVTDVSFSYQAYRFIRKPEPLSDEEALAVYWTGNSIEPALRAVIEAHEAREREIVDYEQSQLPEGYSTNAQGDLTGDHDRILDYEDIEGQIGTMCTDGCDPHALHAWLSARLGK